MMQTGDIMSADRKTSGGLSVSVIIPAYDEVGNIKKVTDETVAALAACDWIDDYEVIIVNDGSSDGTGVEADALASRIESVKVVHHESNKGMGAAMKSGYAAARGDLLVSTCADGEISIHDVISLIGLMGDADLVVSRRERNAGQHRELFTNGFHWLTSLIVGFNTRGMEGVFVIRSSLLRQLHLRSNTSLLTTEVIMQCVRMGRPLKSGVIRVLPRISGQSKMTNVRAMARILLEMCKLRVSLWRYRDQTI